ncbi:MAG TPA: patatin-like phospholipase family protein [Casimicrobiaceae bacterium]|nr:patatin-like phospholipase family protein [Casimicrobiaceae bacterium]
MNLSRRRTISLVLGSGGARGIAHIGAIRWLTDNGYLVRSIAGSSIGALVGGCYAAGKLDALAEWMLSCEKLNLLRLLDPTFGRAGLFKGERIVRLLRRGMGDVAIEDLPLAFTAVATDCASGEEVWLRRGNLVDAIRASMATPLIFTPFEGGERKLLDGGLVNPVPIAPTLDDKTDLTVAVDVFGPPDPALCGASAARGIVNVAIAAMDAMQTAIARLRLATCPPDVLVEVPRTACGYHELWRAEKLIALGRERTAQAFAAARERAREKSAEQLAPQVVAA